MRSGRGDERPGDRGSPVLHNPGPGSHAAAGADAALAGVLELLCAQPQRLEPGLVILDRGLALDDGVEVDVLARDESGAPVAVLFCGADLAQAIGRTAAVLAAIHQGRYLLDRLYGHAGLRSQQRPRFMLIGLRFAASRAADLLQLVGGCDVAVFESRIVRAVDGRPELHLAALARSEFGASMMASAVQGPLDAPVAGLSAAPVEPIAEPVPAAEPRSAADLGHDLPSASHWPLLDPLPSSATADSTADVASDRAADVSGDRTDNGGRGDRGEGAEADEWRVPVIDDVDLLVRAEASPECRRLCLAARDSIRSLSSLVTQTIEPDRICFLVDNVPLATLIPRGETLQLRVGEEGGPAFDVRDDEGFNASLNAIFSHYFSRFAVRA